MERIAISPKERKDLIAKMKAIMELILGVRAEQRSLEDVATPLTAIQKETGASA